MSAVLEVSRQCSVEAIHSPDLDLVSFIRSSPGGRTLNSGSATSLPSVGARETISSHAPQPMVVNDDCQVTLNSPSHAANIVLVLTTSLGRLASRPKNQGCSTPKGHSSTAWIVEVLHRMWDSVNSGICSFMTHDIGARTMRSYIQALVVTAALVKNADRAGGLASRVHNLIARSLVYCLSSSNADAVVKSQDLLISLSKLVMSIFRDHNALPQGLIDQLRKSCTEFAERESQPRSELSTVTQGVIDAFSQSDQRTPHDAGLQDRSGVLVNGNLKHAQSQVAIESAQIIPRPPKRQRLSDGIEDGPKLRLKSGNELLGRLCLLLGDWDRKNLKGLNQAAVGLFSDLSGPQQEEVLAILTILPTSSEEAWKDAEWTSFHDIISTLLDAKEVLQSKVLRIMMASAVKAFAQSTPVVSQLDLTTSALGKWCLQGLRSSVRQLRILAALTLRYYMQAEPLDERTRKNRLIILDVLRQFADLNDARWSESLIVAFGEVACCCDEDERAIAINHLIEFLGHTSKLICDMAYLELEHIAETLEYSRTIELLDPFWKITGVTVVKDLLTRPQKVQQVADLVGSHVDQLLVHIQTEVLPWIVLEKKQDILIRVARARGENTSVFDVCMHPRNLPAILAAIVVQHPDEIEAAVSSCLSHASPDFRGKDPVEFLKVEVITLACELLKIAGDRNGIDREKASHVP